VVEGWERKERESTLPATSKEKKRILKSVFINKEMGTNEKAIKERERRVSLQ